MSSIRNYQRRALESLKPKSQSSLTIFKNNEYYLKQRKFLLFVKKTRIFLLGISLGVGTSADLHGINIAVFGESPPLRSPLTQGQKNEQCEWAVLLRTPTKKEKQTWFQLYKNTCCLTVQRLKIVKQGTSRINFTLAKDKKVYADTI